MPMLLAKLALVEQAVIPVLLVDEQGIIGYVNERLQRLFGYESDQLISEGLDRLAAGTDLDAWRRNWWPILHREREIATFPGHWTHRQGLALERQASVRMVTVAGIDLAAFYLWPKPDYQILQAGDPATAFLEDLGESVGILDPAGTLQYANRALRRMLSVEGLDPIGRSLLDVIVPDEPYFSKVWEALHQNQAQVELEFENLRGDKLAVRMSVSAQCDQAGDVLHRVVSFADITEQRRIARELEFRSASLERLASNIPGFIYTFNMTPDGHFSFPYASRGVKEIFGVEPEEVREDAAPIIKTIHPDDVINFQESVLHSAATLTPWNFEARLTTNEGIWKWFHGASRPQLTEKGDIVWEGVVMDVTDRKQAEEALRQAKNMAEQAAHTRAEFLAIMSHEIRTPLNAIIGLIRWVLESELDEAQRDALTKVRGASDTLLGIINNILDFSKLESGRMSAEQVEFELDQVLEKTATILAGTAADKGLVFAIDCDLKIPPRLRGDPLRLEQVLINLGNNAIKFTEAGEVRICVEMVAETEETVELRFRVKDTGIGLSQAQQEKIFDAFQQADSSTTRNYGGTGLGLSICKGLVEMMGGELKVSSAQGKGSEFQFRLELVCRPGPREQRARMAQAGRGIKISVIVADPQDRRVLAGLLESLGCEVAGFATVEEFQANRERGAQKMRRDLLLVDVEQIGEACGLMTVGSDSGENKIPLIGVASPNPEAPLGMTSGISAVLSRPLLRMPLVRLLEKTLRKALLPITETDTKMGGDWMEQLAGKKILLVEDNAINQEIASKILEAVAIQVTIVGDGGKAVSLLQEMPDGEQPDAVLMDLQMPEMDGFEATLRIRQQARFATLPIVAMTAHAFEEERQRCLAAGMNAHVSKPIDPDRLYGVLATLLGSHRPAVGASTPSSKNYSRHQGLAMLSTVEVPRALELLNQDDKTLLRLLKKFAEDHRNEAAALRADIKEGLYERASRRIHKLKGVAGNLQIASLYRISLRIEKALDEGLEPFPAVLLEEFEVSLRAFLDEIQALAGLPEEEQTAALTPVDPREDHYRLLGQLIHHLQHNNLAAEYSLARLRAHRDLQWHKEIETLTKLVENLDFEAALSVAEQLYRRENIA